MFLSYLLCWYFQTRENVAVVCDLDICNSKNAITDPRSHEQFFKIVPDRFNPEMFQPKSMSDYSTPNRAFSGEKLTHRTPSAFFEIEKH